MVIQSQEEIPNTWRQLDLADLQGVLLVAGAPDVGKSTFARYLFHRLVEMVGKLHESDPATQTSRRVKPAFLDGDPGQSFLGPPATLTLSFSLPEAGELPGPADARRYFVGSTSPHGHMLSILVGAARLCSLAFAGGASWVVYDSCGLIGASQGGLALKSAEIDLLRPAAIFAIQREQELEPLLMPLRRSRRLRIITLKPAESAHKRGTPNRQAHRQAQFSRYFTKSCTLEVDWTKTAVFPFPRFSLGRLVAFEDRAGFTIGLGITRQIDRAWRKVVLQATLGSLNGVNAIRLGDLILDPDTFQDMRIKS
jgi:polynucleotide 5'-hydroxyl-kinase GRC3/NOL9